MSKEASFLITIRVRLSAVDDPDAREKAQAAIPQMNLPAGAEVKLQRLHQHASPTTVPCDFKRC